MAPKPPCCRILGKDAYLRPSSHVYGSECVFILSELTKAAL